MIDGIRDRNRQSCNWKDYMCKYNIGLQIVELIYHVPHHSITALILSSLAPSYQGNQFGFIAAGLACWLAGSLSINSTPLSEFAAMTSALGSGGNSEFQSPRGVRMLTWRVGVFYPQSFPFSKQKSRRFWYFAVGFWRFRLIQEGVLSETEIIWFSSTMMVEGTS